jgi:O-antigen/teichoic acid export membrane protein
VYEHLRRLAGGALIYGVGGIVSRFVSILLLPFFTAYLAPSDYGVLALLAIVSVFLAGFASLGTGASMGICYFEAKTAVERDSVVFSTITGVALSSMSLLIAAVLMRAPASKLLFGTADYGQHLVLIFVQMAVTTMTAPILAQLRMENRAKTYISYSIALAIGVSVANVVAVIVLKGGLLGLLYSAAAMNLLFGIGLLVFYCARKRPDFSLYVFRRVIRLGLPSAFGVGAFFFIDYSGRALIERFAGLSELGVFSLGLSFGMMMTLLADSAFGVAWPAFFISFIDRREEAARVFGKVLLLFSGFYLFLCLAFFLFASPVVHLLTQPAFHGAATVVGGVALCSVLKGVYLIFLPGFYFEKKLYWQTFLEWVAAIVAVGLGWLAIPLWGKEGAVIAAVSAYLVLCFLTYFVGRSFLRVEYSFTRIGGIVVFFLIGAWASFANFGLTFALDALVRMAILLVFGVIVLSLSLSASELKTASRVIRQIVAKTN